MAEDLISVIVPVYNVASYLNRCMDSIYGQTYRKLQIILVDDGSTDGSGLLCDEIQAKHNDNTIVVHKENGGLSSARNAGLDKVTGKYCLFIDSDDYIEPEMIEQLYAMLVKTDSDMSICSYRKVNEKGQLLTKKSLKDEIIDIHQLTDKNDFFLLRFLDYDVTWEAWNKLYKVALIHKYGFRFQPNKEIFAEDLCFNAQYIYQCAVIVTMEYCGYNYVFRGDSIMGKNQAAPHLREHIHLAQRVYHPDMSSLFAPMFYMFVHPCYDKLLPMSDTALKKELQLLQSQDRDAYDFWLSNTQKMTSLYKLLICQYGYAQAMDRLKNVHRLLTLASKGKTAGTFLWKAELYQKQLVAKALTRRMFRQVQNDFAAASIHRCIYLIGTEDFGNLGDHMIAEAAHGYLSQKYPHNHIFEITASQFMDAFENLKRQIRKKDIIYLTGGGNMGNAYPLAEDIRRRVIGYFQKNMIVILPQTIYYTKDQQGEQEAELTKEIYNAHQNLTILLRDKQSFAYAKANYSAHIELRRDLVLSYQGELTKGAFEREGMLLCLRHDKERSLKDSDEQRIKEMIRQSGKLFLCCDTQKTYQIAYTSRKKALKDYLRLVKSSELVVTDRLHGMIFSAITDTPCIVFDNYNGKVTGTYELMGNTDKIHVVGDIRDFETAYRRCVDVPHAQEGK